MARHHKLHKKLKGESMEEFVKRIESARIALYDSDKRPAGMKRPSWIARKRAEFGGVYKDANGNYCSRENAVLEFLTKKGARKTHGTSWIPIRPKTRYPER